MTEAQKISIAKREFADALYDSNLFPMWKRNDYGTATQLRYCHTCKNQPK